MSELNDIFGNDKKKLSDEELLKYLDGKASNEEQHAVEKGTANEGFESEALEGLAQFKSKHSLDDYVQQLNKNLHTQLNQKKLKKEKRQIKEIPIGILTVMIILVLCVLGFMLVQLLQK